MAYQLVMLMRDASVKQALDAALKGDGRLSFNDVKSILRAALDGDGVTIREFEDLKNLLAKSKTMDAKAKELVDQFLKQHYRPRVPVPKTDAGQLTKNFHLNEFACKDGTAVPNNLLPNVRRLAENLQVLRDKLGLPIRINSAYRTVTHNSAIGGASSSQHLYGKAADIVASGKSPSEVRKAIQLLIDAGKMSEGGIGRYNTFVHYDIRGVRARW